MDIKVTNFGPIEHASITIKPITVIIGKNNKGKSFLSQLIYSVITSFRGARISEYHPSFRSVGLKDIGSDFIIDELYEETNIKHQIRQFTADKINRQQLITDIFYSISLLYSNWIKILLKDQLERTFGFDICDLVRVGATRSTIIIRCSSSCYFRIIIGKSGSMSSTLKFYDDKLLLDCINNKELIPSLESMRIKRSRTRQLNIIIQAVRNNVRIGPEMDYPYYLPAGRAGLIDSWETITSAWTVLASASIPRGITMPPLPGTGAMFYNITQSLEGRSSEQFNKLCENFRVLLNGDIIVNVDRTLGGKRNIIYKFKHLKHTKSINIIHAASMIKELGPLYLFIREVLRPRDIFIVEEPESHLHPAAQRFFIMQIIVGLVEQGVYSIFTTHSDLLIRTLAHSVYASSLQKSIKRLSIDKISIYLFRDGTKGSITKNVKISTKGTLESLPTFDEVIEELYEDEIRSYIPR